ncbi:MAG: sigma-70 family RNA polymerase sigma factor [Bacteroidales bacterium]|jgi:RNA polymerase sigma-70 factor (ECF subfamily)|nr:sigma-70 family RNA polymerase sigma factor [Bacteroidales bacterium]MBQ6667002.1 sigma-70 family RNA polymerase sigma factor [Bacteroidales bacterium]MBR4340013.1 sigma-70 family RNA polymerase sigma factor [Bacteroidales bacterium]MBR4492530.1 sigma-70 family RNA polymerase sigma factor [Bacteroidales bacterium]MBR4513127.1 sigma-70 family RNA polymerase sigma factor [Bacteroidales bacterium]
MATDAKYNRACDEQLVSYYIAGNEDALEALIGRYQQKIFSYILTIVHDKDLAEDLFQDTFIKVIHTLRAGNYREEGKFNQWIMRITRNLIIDHFRKNQKMSFVDNNNKNDIFDFFSEPSMSVEQCMITEQIHDSLRSLITLLPEEQKEVLTMRLYQDMSFKEIANATDVSINTALGRMRYAILNLRKMVKEKNIVLTY